MSHPTEKEKAAAEADAKTKAAHAAAEKTAAAHPYVTKRSAEQAEADAEFAATEEVRLGDLKEVADEAKAKAVRTAAAARAILEDVLTKKKPRRGDGTNTPREPEPDRICVWTNAHEKAEDFVRLVDQHAITEVHRS